MGLMDVLGRYAQPAPHTPPHVFDDFDSVAREAPHDLLSDGLEEAFNAEVTPPFEQMVGQLYDRAEPPQRAAFLNEILQSLGRGRVSPDEARSIPSTEVEAAAAEAARHNPSIIQQASRFFAQHPQLLQTLGQVAIGIAMNGMARRRRL